MARRKFRQGLKQHDAKLDRETHWWQTGKGLKPKRSRPDDQSASYEWVHGRWERRVR